MSIKSDAIVVRGKLSFMHLTKPDDFKGNVKYKFRLTNLSDAAVQAIHDKFGEDAGMGHKRVKFDEKYPDAGFYAGFSSKFPIKVKLDKRDIITGGKDVNGNDIPRILDPVAESIGYGSVADVRLFADSNGNPRVDFVNIRDLVTYDTEEEVDYDDEEVL